MPIRNSSWLALLAPLSWGIANGPALAAHQSRNDPCGPVILLGVDGMTFDVIDPLVAQGRMPTLKRLLDQGARGFLKSERPMRSPALWTTIATGQPRKVHGIYDFVTGSYYWPKSQRSTEQKLVTSDMRRAPALWHFASMAGRRTMVVGWLNTWPAERVNGVMVAPYVALGERRQTSIKGKIYQNAQHQTYPEDYFQSIRPLVVAPDEVDPALTRMVVETPEPGSSLYRRVPRLKRYLYTVNWSIAGALTNTAIIKREMAASRDWSLVMSYFDGADTLAHRFWVMRESLPLIRERLKDHGMDPALAPELKQRLGHAVDGYYELFDQLLAQILAASPPHATVILVSDHGFGSTRDNKAAYATVPFDGEHRTNGVFLAQGPHIKKGKIAPLTQYDITPTILYLLGGKVPEALPGRVAMEMVTEDFARQHPPLVLADQQPLPQTPTNAGGPGKSHFMGQELERLRSLGYVQ